MGRNMRIELMHNGTTIRRVNHFTNCAMNKEYYIKIVTIFQHFLLFFLLFLKFIHIADVHWGARPEREQTFGRIREQEIKETFQRVIDHANKQQADLLLIAGDLFDQPPTQQELREVDYLLSRLNHTRTVLIAGHHDHLGPHGAFSQ